MGVDQPDVNLDEDDEPVPDQVDDAMETDEPEHQENQESNKKNLKLSYEQYKKMSFLLIDHIRAKEEEQEMSESDKTDATPTKGDLINWYLEQKLIVEKVVDRLIYQDQVIVPLNNPGAKGEENPFLVIHPNYNVMEG